MGTREDIKLYPVYFYDEELQEIYEIENKEDLLDGEGKENWNFTRDFHHYIRTQEIRNNPEKYTEEFLNEHQKLFLLPRVMHNELHGKHSRFFEKYGIRKSDLLFSYKNKCGDKGENDI